MNDSKIVNDCHNSQHLRSEGRVLTLFNIIQTCSLDNRNRPLQHFIAIGVYTQETLLIL